MEKKVLCRNEENGTSYLTSISTKIDWTMKNTYFINYKWTLLFCAPNQRSRISLLVHKLSFVPHNPYEFNLNPFIRSFYRSFENFFCVIRYLVRGFLAERERNETLRVCTGTESTVSQIQIAHRDVPTSHRQPITHTVRSKEQINVCRREQNTLKGRSNCKSDISRKTDK